MKFGRTVFELCVWTDTQTDAQTDRLITILRNPNGAKYNKVFGRGRWHSTVLPRSLLNAFEAATRAYRHLAIGADGWIAASLLY